jgi:hypothetical protein
MAEFPASRTNGDPFTPPCDHTARLVVVTTGPFDLRTGAALHVAQSIPAAARVGLHVATDPSVADAVRRGWTTAGVEMPLVVTDAIGGIEAAVVEYIRAALDSVADAVTLVAGRLLPAGRWHRFRHDATAAAIARAVVDDERVTPILVAVAPSSVKSLS